MNISLDWLADYVELQGISPQQIAQDLTAAGLEVEDVHTVERIPGGLQGVVVGRVLTVAQHPNADRLRLTTVDVGQSQPLHIVCGAPNVAAGQDVLVATVGTTLHPLGGQPLVIKESKIRGELSQGMICAEDELGLGEGHDGILVLTGSPTPGTPAAEHLGLRSDTVLSIGVTPNRTDALSHYGVARDLAAIRKLPLRSWQTTPVPAAEPSPIAISVADPAQCPLYVGRTIRGVRVAPSPEWLQRRLQAIGLRPINNVVDITNYVLHASGQPLHAFDLAQITGSRIEVRSVADGTEFVTLDGNTRRLRATDLLVCDASRPLVLAGTMGGLSSGVTDSTTDLFLEAAVFEAQAVRAQSRRLNLFSDSSYRFERGVDGNQTQAALEYATQLILELAGGVASQVTRVGPEAFPPAEVAFSYDACRGLIGKHLSDEEITAILHRLEYQVEPTAPGTARLRVPTYRLDVTRQQDVVEDVVRIYGLDEVAPAQALRASLPSGRQSDPTRLRHAVADALAAAGWQEILTNSLVPEAWTDASRVPMENPLSEELAVLRTHLLPSGLEVVAHNLARKQADLRLFELGKVYAQNAGQYQETWQLGLWLTGADRPTHWRSTAQPADFFHLQGVVQHLLTSLALPPTTTTAVAAAEDLAYGLQLQVNGQVLVRYGAVAADWLRKLDIPQPVYHAVVDWAVLQAVLAQRPKLEAAELPRYPAVRRDLSVVVPPGVDFAQLRSTIAQASNALIQSVEVVDVYEPAQSYTLSITLQDRNKTLTDDAVDKQMQRVLSLLERDLGVKLRA